MFLPQAKHSADCSVSGVRNNRTMTDRGEAAYYCYIVQCADRTFYTGWTTDPQRRARQHNNGVGAKYTRTHRPVTLVYLEELPGRSEAMKREHAIKRMSRSRKEALILSHPITDKSENE